MKRIGILLCCIVLCLLFPEKVHAEEIVSEKEPVDIIFVIDCSGSMKTNDVSRMGLSMVQAFVDRLKISVLDMWLTMTAFYLILHRNP
jgi:hypothetical protein